MSLKMICVECSSSNFPINDDESIQRQHKQKGYNVFMGDCTLMNRIFLASYPLGMAV